MGGDRSGHRSVATPAPSLAATYRLQEIWAAWNLGAVRGLFSLSFTVDGTPEISPGPILVLFGPRGLEAVDAPVVFFIALLAPDATEDETETERVSRAVAAAGG